MRLQIFDVEHGACALLMADNSARLMIDCGHNGITGWKPGTYLRHLGITQLEMLAITNYDEDHASGAVDLFDNVFVGWILRNQTVSGSTIRILKREQGMGPGIERLANAIDYSFTPPGAITAPEPVFQGCERRVFYNAYRTFDDENNLSMVLFLKSHGVGVMFSGDLEVSGFDRLLRCDSFRQTLAETNVYVASHHGRESGCSEAVASHLTCVYYVVISGKGTTTRRSVRFRSTNVSRLAAPFGTKRLEGY